MSTIESLHQYKSELYHLSNRVQLLIKRKDDFFDYSVLQDIVMRIVEILESANPEKGTLVAIMKEKVYFSLAQVLERTSEMEQDQNEDILIRFDLLAKTQASIQSLIQVL
ncbi:hypothetical protein [Xanthocytophaga agilis]|uniref:Uncharacterized protein n=1 Tax=Xanthocytophaga agilis TaxID=3048010 RepID=A0AAE3R2X1_9BACT|nr:hypothetical protein [Xanthocytophaga agilis]MDJ1502754.1 hypothetical protein [Xanthocytophaga agilis]